MLSVLASLRAGVAVVDDDLAILAWNTQAEELWGIRADESLGRHLSNLDIGLPVADLRAAARRALAGDESDPVELQARDRRGRPVVATSTFSPLRGLDGEIRGVILAMTADPTEESS